ncbi:LOW QUALITY PROTEIN: monocarboxylate transporter 12-B-like [Panulirus ornatus]|uniref:LOW QUALITY PROTEIN: monocarboxylate transporter 12-B-like n=1 Tax=Panulirus ornatus TaxID=150431 RepID=UPI003A853694
MTGAALHGNQQVLGEAAAGDQGVLASSRGSRGYHIREDGGVVKTRRDGGEVTDGHVKDNGEALRSGEDEEVGGDGCEKFDDAFIKDSEEAVRGGDEAVKIDDFMKDEDKYMQQACKAGESDDNLTRHDEEIAQVCGDAGLTRVPDGGWGWMIVLGSFIILLLVPVVGLSFGVLFSRYLLGEGTSSSTTAWIFNTQCFVWNMMGFLVRPLAKEFSWRRVAIVGVLLASTSTIISAFSPSPEFLFFSFSLLNGVGGGLVVCMCFILVPMYFDRRRGVANAVTMSGIPIGQMAGPPLVRFLQDEYGFKGATLIIGAILLNGLVGAAFFHPVEWHMKPPRLGLIEEGSVHLMREDIVKVRQRGRCGDSSSGADDKDESGRLSRGSHGVTVWQDDPLSLKERSYLTSMDDMTLSLSSQSQSSLAAAPAVVSVKESIARKGSKGIKRLPKVFMQVVRTTIADLGVFRSPCAVIISFGSSLFLNGYYNFAMMVPFAMQAAGHTLQDSATCISVSAVCNLLARGLISALSDCRGFNMRAVYMTGITTSATCVFVFPLLSDLGWMMATMAVWGSGVGTTMGLFNLVMVRFMGLDKLAPVFGASSLTIGAGFLFFGPLTGVIRDVSGSYAVSMWVLSGIMFTATILWLFMPAAQAYDQRRRAKENEKKVFNV